MARGRSPNSSGGFWMQARQQELLSPEKLQLFAAALSGLSPEEVRKSKSLYLRNAIAEYRAMQASLEGFAQAQGCLSIIPIFWPIIGAPETHDGRTVAIDSGSHSQRDRGLEG